MRKDDEQGAPFDVPVRLKGRQEQMLAIINVRNGGAGV
ncbi:Uncharacterized protein APZ42_024902 [Daphnia magna]|uniref:Uncharacterized protein n=1 Tax=Daphnia magna TaxID=35525 RepID=A0A164TNF2_9CRUS|nr:Uncharacterized protein APZ42_024902 [Daphnia magna]